MQLIHLFVIFSLASVMSSIDIKLSDVSSIISYIGERKHKVNLLVDPMSTMTYIFETNRTKELKSSLSNTGKKENITTPYGQFIGNYLSETFNLDNDTGLSFKLGFMFVEYTTNTLNNTYDGIIGLGYDNKTLLSIYNQCGLCPTMKLDLKKRIITFNETSKLAEYLSSSFHIKESEKNPSVLLFNLSSIKLNSSSLPDSINGNGKLDLWKSNYIIAPFNQEKPLFFGFFNRTTNGGLIYTDVNKSKEYINYFFPMSYKPSKDKSCIEIENKTYDFLSWYNEANNSDIAYSTIKLQLDDGSENEDWMIGVKVLGYEMIEFDYGNNKIFFYNQQFLISWAYALTGIIGIISIGFIIYFIKKRNQSNEQSPKVEEEELIDKKPKKTNQS